MSAPLSKSHHLADLTAGHGRRGFRCGHPKVDEWLARHALQSQDKHVTTTKVLADARGAVAGFYTLATTQIDFGALPTDLAHRLPRRHLPAAVLAWLGIAEEHQRVGVGSWLLARALRDCHRAGRTFAFVAVLVDCIDDRARSWYARFDFRELPGQPYRLFLSWAELEAMMAAS